MTSSPIGIQIINGTQWLLHKLTLLIGSIVLLALVLTLTPVPWWVYSYFGGPVADLKNIPDYIVMMGGGGIPSESGLTRSYETARIALICPNTPVIVAMPGTDAKDSAVSRCINELVMRGVARKRILVEPKGVNTHLQAVNIEKMVRKKKAVADIIVVTSPEHMLRTRLTFHKAGMPGMRGGPVFDQAIDDPMEIKPVGPEKSKSALETIGNSLTLRYRIWSNLDYERRIVREIAALAYYKYRGWL